jgi:hypothetical protein
MAEGLLILSIFLYGLWLHYQWCDKKIENCKYDIPDVIETKKKPWFYA